MCGKKRLQGDGKLNAITNLSLAAAEGTGNFAGWLSILKRWLSFFFTTERYELINMFVPKTK